MASRMKKTDGVASVDRPEKLGNRKMGWGSDAIAELAARMDLKYMSLVPGASYRGFHDSIVNYLGNTNPQMIICMHEEHAVAIAQGYAKVTDKPMFVSLHSNVGLMHASMAIFNAWCDRTPMIIFGATGPVDAHRRRPWIDWIHTSKDQASMIRNYTKWDDQPASPAAARESILRASWLAQVQWGTVNTSWRDHSKRCSPMVERPSPATTRQIALYVVRVARVLDSILFRKRSKVDITEPPFFE